MKRSRRRRRPKITIPTTSMGDIAFLLIIFFIICSTKKVGVTLTPPHAPGLGELPKPDIYVGVDANEVIHVDTREVFGPGQVEAEVSRRLARLDPNAPSEKRIVIFECDQSVKKEVFEPILEAIAKGGGIIGAVGTDSGKSGR